MKNRRKAPTMPTPIPRDLGSAMPTSFILNTSVSIHKCYMLQLFQFIMQYHSNLKK